MAPSPPQPWKTAFSFGERVAIVEHIVSSLKLSDPSLENSSALSSARVIETESYDMSFSQEEYTRTWEAKLRELKARLAEKQLEARDLSPVSESDNGSNDGASQDIAHATDRGITIGRFTGCRHHNSGIFSDVYKALLKPMTLMSPAQFVALKVTIPSRMAPPHNSHREARFLQKSEHKCIVKLLEKFTLPTSQFVMVFPFYNHNLDTLLKSNIKITSDQMTGIFQDILCALEHIHSMGIIHRDVKPSNILLADADGPAVLADFGIAWSPEDSESEPAERKITDVGTTCYRPPEILFGNTAYSTSLDMWAFGCVVAECYIDGHEPLFDAGDLGSELQLIGSIFRKLGTPTLETWPEAANFSDFGKICFNDFPTQKWEDILPDAPQAARELVSELVVYESGRRLSASEVRCPDIYNTAMHTDPNRRWIPICLSEWGDRHL
ncbi:kinase-like protein [Choiromyces venosus 120613-1]|uniref:cyclin-dependent kinase n=1 Tax=Choiromyces venosus 120613-1 TaxID=1336337 RepID=A0A3N4JG59_9PEZI|nr:kinase-like protein [Choiromyces venosus 120613-1]